MTSGSDAMAAGCPAAPGGYEAPPIPLGPDSLTWKYFGDWRGMLQGPWAGSMQNMHPQLGAAVEEHSIFFQERWPRLLRSLYPIGGVVFDGDRAPQTGAEVRVALALPPAYGGLAREPADGASIDAAPLAAIPDGPDPSRLTTTAWDGDETLHTSLFRSVCPVTGQPDYAAVIVRYRGPRIDRGSLLAYLAGYRRHPGFHEACVERIFVDLLAACRPNKLAVEARFTRRGGVDINPFRTNETTWRARSAPDVRQ